MSGIVTRTRESMKTEFEGHLQTEGGEKASLHEAISSLQQRVANEVAGKHDLESQLSQQLSNHKK